MGALERPGGSGGLAGRNGDSGIGMEGAGTGAISGDAASSLRDVACGTMDGEGLRRPLRVLAGEPERGEARRDRGRTIADPRCWLPALSHLPPARAEESGAKFEMGACSDCCNASRSRDATPGSAEVSPVSSGEKKLRAYDTLSLAPYRDTSGSSVSVCKATPVGGVADPHCCNPPEESR